MSPRAEFDKGTMLFTQTSCADFEDLCRLDILGLADTTENQDMVYEDFKEQLKRDSAGWTRLIFHGSPIIQTYQRTKSEVNGDLSIS